MAALSNSSSGPAGALSYFFSLNNSIPQGLGYSITGLKIINLDHSLGFYGYADFYDLVKNNEKILNLKKINLNFLLKNNEFFKINNTLRFKKNI